MNLDIPLRVRNSWDQGHLVFGAEIRMHSFTDDCDRFSNEEKVAVVVSVTSVEVTCSEPMLVQSFSTLLVGCQME